ncbi:MAG TPA: hypothetical protein VHJ20_07155 [Polyangia bacterium]|nr:hypothetical protein [Polyangia bacterium]
MTSPRVWKRGTVSVGALVVSAAVMVSGVAHADVVFRKKPPAATDDSAAGTEASPTGGEPAADKTNYVPQATDEKDYPELQAEKDKQAADAALARDARKAQLQRDKEKGDPIYKKWEFWAVTGAVVVGAVLAIWGGSAVLHQINGGDVQPCPMGANDGCFGQGR